MTVRNIIFFRNVVQAFSMSQGHYCNWFGCCLRGSWARFRCLKLEILSEKPSDPCALCCFAYSVQSEDKEARVSRELIFAQCVDPEINEVSSPEEPVEATKEARVEVAEEPAVENVAEITHEPEAIEAPLVKPPVPVANNQISSGEVSPLKLMISTSQSYCIRWDKLYIRQQRCFSFVLGTCLQ